ncbi:MAG: potassium channel family protein [Nannocystaceae bacterium]
MTKPTQQAIVIGLGQFGSTLARALAERNVEVLGVDLLEERVQAIAPYVSDAACLDATETDALAKLAPERRDFCVCAIGDDARDATILCTALLRQLGAPRIISRANDELLARILNLVGAHQVVNPAREFGQRFANQILHAGLLDEMRLGDDIVVSEVECPRAFIGRSLRELTLPSRYGVTIVALRRRDGAVKMPDPNTPLADGDVLVLVARDGQVAKMIDRN